MISRKVTRQSLSIAGSLEAKVGRAKLRNCCRRRAAEKKVIKGGEWAAFNGRRAGFKDDTPSAADCTCGRGDYRFCPAPSDAGAEIITLSACEIRDTARDDTSRVTRAGGALPGVRGRCASDDARARTPAASEIKSAECGGRGLRLDFA